MPILLETTPNVDIELLEERHQHFVRLIHALEKVSVQNREEVRSVFSDIMAYVKQHFLAEEHLMQEMNYPNGKEHKLVHQHFVERISLLYERFERGEKIRDELLSMLKAWFVLHIQHEDMAYMYFYRKMYDAT